MESLKAGAHQEKDPASTIGVHQAKDSASTTRRARGKDLAMTVRAYQGGSQESATIAVHNDIGPLIANAIPARLGGKARI